MPEILVLFLLVLLVLVVGWICFEIINRMGLDPNATKIVRVVVGVILLVILLWILIDRTGFLAGVE